MSHLAITNGSNDSQLHSAAENCYLPDWFNDAAQGVIFGMLGHMAMEYCEMVGRDDPESGAPYFISVICCLGGGVLEAYARSKVGNTGAAFFGSLVASKLPFYGFTGKNVQIITAAMTGAGVKRLIDKAKWFR